MKEPKELENLKMIAVVGMNGSGKTEAVDYLTLEPLYLRAPQAERQKNLRELGHE